MTEREKESNQTTLTAPATLRDVAARAGVNVATASVVLNQTRSGTRVSEATRERIREAAVALNYRANAAARGMKRRRMETLGVVGMTHGSELNLYFLELLNGMLEAAAHRTQNTTVFSVTDWSDDARILGFCDGRVDGFILIGARLRPEFAARLRARLPFVTIHGEGSLPDIWNLDVANETGAFQAVRHLIEQGHRRILHITGQMAEGSARDRLAGYRRALETGGIPYDETLVVPSRFSYNAGKAATAAYLSDCPRDSLPTAIFCASDAIAVGCMEALAERGLRVPDDFSIVGFDDTMAARMTYPPLTTVCQPFREMGKKAVELLLAEMDRSRAGGETPGLRQFDAELVVRSSVGLPSRGVGG